MYFRFTSILGMKVKNAAWKITSKKKKTESCRSRKARLSACDWEQKAIHTNTVKHANKGKTESLSYADFLAKARLQNKRILVCRHLPHKLHSRNGLLEKCHLLSLCSRSLKMASSHFCLSSAFLAMQTNHLFFAVLWIFQPLVTV